MAPKAVVTANSTRSSGQTYIIEGGRCSDAVWVAGIDARAEDDEVIGWISRNRRLARDFERHAHAVAPPWQTFATMDY